MDVMRAWTVVAVVVGVGACGGGGKKRARDAAAEAPIADTATRLDVAAPDTAADARTDAAVAPQTDGGPGADAPRGDGAPGADAAPGDTSQDAADAASDAAADMAPDTTPDAAPDTTPDATPDTAPDTRVAPGTTLSVQRMPMLPAGIARDTAGNLYVTGGIRSGVDLGTKDLRCPSTTKEDCIGFLVAKYDEEGRTQWARTAAQNSSLYSLSASTGRHIAVNDAGEIFVAAVRTSPVDFGGGALEGTGYTGEDAVIVKLSVAGDHLWSRRYGAGGADWLESIAAIPGGGAASAGYTYASRVDLGGAPVGPIFGVALSAGGEHAFSRSFGESNLFQGRRVAANAAGDVYFTGNSSGTIDLGAGPVASAGSDDIFLARYRRDGTHVMSKRIGGADYEEARGLAIDAAGNIYLAGGFERQLDLGGGPLTSAGRKDMFLAKLAPDGSHLWSRRFGGDRHDQIDGIVLDGEGNLVVYGSYATSTTIDGHVLTGAADSFDGFVFRTDASGKPLWVRRLGGTSAQPYGAVFDRAGNVVVAGWGRGPGNLGIARSDLPANDGAGFLLKIAR